MITGFRRSVFGSASLTSESSPAIVIHGDTTKITMRSNGLMAWTNDSANADTTLDTGISRNAAGVLEVDNGTAGSLSTLVAGNVGIGTTSPAAPLDVVGNAKVSGNVQMGWERTAATSVLVNAGTLATVTVSCSAGKKIVGGGCNSNWYQTYITQNYPLNDTTWQCAAYANSGTSSTLYAYAICARIDN